MTTGSTGGTSPKSFLPENLGGWVDLVAKAGAILVIAFGVYQFLETQRATRVTRTQDLMIRYSSEPVRDAREAISGVLRDNAQAIRQVRSVALQPSAAAEAHKDLVQYFVNESRGGTGLASEIDTLIDFYRTVEVCVAQELCEANVAVAYFSDDARRLIENFRPYVVERRALAPEYAVSVERLAQPSARR